jgi:Arc/MetJ-type ribon-helix-helix transcriptional regulator
MVQVQVRVPERFVKEIDRWVSEGRYASRSDAIKTILAIHEERERTRQFYSMLAQRGREAHAKSVILVRLDEID